MSRKDPEIAPYIFNYIEDFRDSYGYAPSLREIEAALGIPKSTVQRYLTDLSKEGKILYENGKIKTANGKTEATTRVPVLGTVSCGPLKLAEEQHDECVKLPVSMFGSSDLFILEADGESMIEAGISPGDKVVFRQQCTVENGEIAVVLVDDEATLKRVYRENGVIRLHPENSYMKDIYVDDCKILGKAISVIKMF